MEFPSLTIYILPLQFFIMESVVKISMNFALTPWRSYFWNVFIDDVFQLSTIGGRYEVEVPVGTHELTVKLAHRKKKLIVDFTEGLEIYVEYDVLWGKPSIMVARC